MAADDEIKHVVLLMMENHSFDQMLGCLQDEYGELEGVDLSARTARFNLDLSGKQVFQAPTDEQQMQREGVAAGHLLEDLARMAGFWMKLREQVGRVLRWIANRLTRTGDRNQTAKVRATAEVARRVFSRGESQAGPSEL